MLNEHTEINNGALETAYIHKWRSQSGRERVKTSGEREGSCSILSLPPLLFYSNQPPAFLSYIDKETGVMPMLSVILLRHPR